MDQFAATIRVPRPSSLEEAAIRSGLRRQAFRLHFDLATEHCVDTTHIAADRTIGLTDDRGDCTVPFWGRRLLRHRGITATAGAAALVVIAGSTFAAVSSAGTGHETLANAGDSKSLIQAKTKDAPVPVRPLRVVSVSPGSGAQGVNGAAPVKVTFSSDLAPSTPLPSLSPDIPGSWQVSGATATFTPQDGYLANTSVTLKIPGGNAGVQGAAGAGNVLAKTTTVSFTTGSFSTLRLQELLAQLGYLPFTWTPGDPATGQVSANDANAQLAAAYDAPAGSFAWNGQYPSELTSQWQAGQANMLDDGAIRAFESDQGLTMDGEAGPQVWSHLLTAVAKDETNSNGYTYALVDQDSPDETLRVWHDGRLIMDTPANTGIPQSPTDDGTFPVYLRYQVTQMQGTNPDGTPYNDTVFWVSYFNGGDALHYFPRPGYGYYQSLGCVELEYQPAEYIWKYTTYGTLVTVEGPVA
jgi:peptidoglycan hydrolase-like protein with peptidoglycan-binding domain